MHTHLHPRNRYSQGRSGPLPHIGPSFGSDRLGVVGFHSRAFVIAKPADPFAPWLQERVQKLPSQVSGSCTNLASGLELSLDILERTPKGVRRRIWLLSDGMPNYGNERLPGLAARARRQWVNVNTVQFGDRSSSNERNLRDIAGATHNGQFYQLDNLRELKSAFLRSAKAPKRAARRHRSETTVFCVDLSGSMVGPMEGKRKIDVVAEALMTLLEYKQRLWS